MEIKEVNPEEIIEKLNKLLARMKYKEEEKNEEKLRDTS